MSKKQAEGRVNLREFSDAISQQESVRRKQEEITGNWELGS
jgi:hypothetical protein